MTEREELIKRLTATICKQFGTGVDYAENIYVRVYDDGEGILLADWVKEIAGALTAQQSQEPVAWMIEVITMPSVMWFTGEFSQISETRKTAIFSADPNACVRYPTEKAAENAFNEMLERRPRVLLGYDNYKITQHQWHTAPLSGVRAGMLLAAEICKEWEGKLSQGAGYAIRTAREAITRAADQVNAEGQK